MTNKSEHRKVVLGFGSLEVFGNPHYKSFDYVMGLEASLERGEEEFEVTKWRQHV